MNPPPLPLNQYLEMLEGLCRPLDRNGLQQCILALAKQVKSEDRRVFLENFRSLLPGEHRETALSTEELSLMSEIETIRSEIESRLRSLHRLSSREAGEDDSDCSLNNRRLLH